MAINFWGTLIVFMLVALLLVGFSPTRTIEKFAFLINNKLKSVYLLITTLFIFSSCGKEIDLPVIEVGRFEKEVLPYLSISEVAPVINVSLPVYSTGLFDVAEVKGEKVQLGRVLFYDRNLSEDGKVSCSSCHQQEHAFSDPRRFSLGIYGRQSTRNSMALANTIWFGGSMGIDSFGVVRLPLFWDSRAHSINEQAKSAFVNEHEMGLTMVEVVHKVQQQPYYLWLFEQAWGDTVVTDHRIFEALAHFMSPLSAADTQFDKELRNVGGLDFLGVSFFRFSASQNRGKSLYIEHCHSCHGSLYSPPIIFEANNGLENPYTDLGKGAITGLFYERGVFRVPGLRNIAFSAPYMHDGRFSTLLEVIEHYNSGVRQIFGLHGDLLTFNEDTQTYSPKRLDLSESDKMAIVDFLLTLTDTASLVDPRFSDPFKR